MFDKPLRLPGRSGFFGTKSAIDDQGISAVRVNRSYRL
jgi:hypothetical protein